MSPVRKTVNMNNCGKIFQGDLNKELSYGMSKGFTPLVRQLVMFQNKKFKRRVERRGSLTGFTLVELTVTLGIAIIISTLVLADFPDFARRLELSRTAQAIALSFREAESSALAVREFGLGIFPAYGIHFENLPAKSYVLFADPNANRAYEADEKVDTFVINGLPEIVRLCGGAKSAPPGNCALSVLDVVFVRPNPDIFINNGAFPDAEIVVRLPSGQEKQIIIWTTGQLSIESL